MYRTNRPLILASHSPRRIAYLQELGLTFEQCGADIDETPLKVETPQKYVERMAFEKAHRVALENTSSYVLAADTAVCLEENILGKPVDKQQAVAMVLSLAGRTHLVRSGICLMHLDSDTKLVQSVCTAVTFYPFDNEVAQGYVAQGESLDKAGAYGIQGRGAFLVSRIEGSYTNVVGLPLTEVVEMLTSHGVIDL